MTGRLLGSAPEIDVYLSGEKLHGDDFGADEVDSWFVSESEGYANLGSRDRYTYKYGYHALNKRHCFRFVEKKGLREVLGVGSAYGDEFLPITGMVDRIIALDPSEAFSGVTDIEGTPCDHVKPAAGGDLPFESDRFDLITCFGVLHHIPNVSHVMSECYRCLASGGLLLVREPVVSMGDWRKPRAGLTRNERGIPLGVFDRIISDCGFRVKKRTFCDFTPIIALVAAAGIDPFNSTAIVAVDEVLSRLFHWNWKYHRRRLVDKFAPASLAYVLEKQ